MRKAKFSTVAVAILFTMVLLITSCSGKINYNQPSGSSSQSASHSQNNEITQTTKTESSSVDTLEQYYDRCDVKSAVSDFLMHVKYQEPAQALAYTTKTEEIINCVNLAVDPEAAFNSQTWDDDTRYIMIDLLLPIMKSMGYFLTSKEPVLTSETTAEIEVYSNNISCQKAFTELLRRVDNLSDRDIKFYSGLYSSEYQVYGEDIEQDKLDKYILYQEASGLIYDGSYLEEPYTFKVYLEEIDGEWLINSFSDNDDFVDVFLWRLSKMKN